MNPRRVARYRGIRREHPRLPARQAWLWSGAEPEPVEWSAGRGGADYAAAWTVDGFTVRAELRPDSIGDYSHLGELSDPGDPEAIRVRGPRGPVWVRPAQSVAELRNGWARTMDRHSAETRARSAARRDAEMYANAGATWTQWDERVSVSFCDVELSDIWVGGFDIGEEDPRTSRDVADYVRRELAPEALHAARDKLATIAEEYAERERTRGPFR